MLVGYPWRWNSCAAYCKRVRLADWRRRLRPALDALRSDMHDPQRHLSLKAVFLHSWRLLTGEENGYWRRWVFREGFTLPAFCAVSRADEPTLRALVQKSLVQAVGPFDLHPPIAQYLRELLDAGEHAAATHPPLPPHSGLCRSRVAAVGWAKADGCAGPTSRRGRNLLAAWQT